MNEKLFQIALTLLPNVGSVLAKNLIAYCGSAENIFKTPSSKLEKIPGIGKERATGIKNAEVLNRAEEELCFIDKYQIKPLFFTDTDYPYRLKECNDSPVMLYYKGNADLNAQKVVAVVGTRKITDYGKERTKKLVTDLAAQNLLVVSGLAYGVDVAAHHAAIENSIATVGVLGHGLNTIYPKQHKNVAKKMLENGGLLTEYNSTEPMHPANFPNRNRIVAGMSDAIVVVESAKEGGALLTANVANSYNRDVFAFPGKVTDKYSSGCNFLIKTFKARIIENADDLLHEMNWHKEGQNVKAPKTQKQLALTLNESELQVYNFLKERTETAIDEIAGNIPTNTSALAATLLEMEMNGILISLPGKRYKLV